MMYTKLMLLQHIWNQEPHLEGHYKMAT